MRTDIKFVRAVHKTGTIQMRIGVGADGSLWVPAAFLGFRDDALECLQRKHGGSVVLMDIDDGCVYVDSRAVVINCQDPIIRKMLEQKTASLVNQLNRQMSADESARNN